MSSSFVGCDFCCEYVRVIVSRRGEISRKVRPLERTMRVVFVSSKFWEDLRMRRGRVMRSMRLFYRLVSGIFSVKGGFYERTFNKI